MRILVWLLGVLVLLLGVEISYEFAHWWVWLWWIMLPVWILVGLGVSIAAIFSKAVAQGRVNLNRPTVSAAADRGAAGRE